jgi:hypothetical protein
LIVSFSLSLSLQESNQKLFVANQKLAELEDETTRMQTTVAEREADAANDHEQLQALFAASEHKKSSLESDLNQQVAANDLLEVCSRCVCAQY